MAETAESTWGGSGQQLNRECFSILKIGTAEPIAQYQL